ncbi:MAG: hypothetical protein WAT22_14335 [Saprospiraceae bacterium]
MKRTFLIIFNIFLFIQVCNAQIFKDKHITFYSSFSFGHNLLTNRGKYILTDFELNYSKARTININLQCFINDFGLSLDFVTTSYIYDFQYTPSGINKEFSAIKYYPFTVYNPAGYFGLNYKFAYRKFLITPKFLFGAGLSEILDYGTILRENNTNIIRKVKIYFIDDPKFRYTFGVDAKYMITKGIGLYVGFHLDRLDANSNFTISAMDKKNDFKVNDNIKLKTNALNISYGIVIGQ